MEGTQTEVPVTIPETPSTSSENQHPNEQAQPIDPKEQLTLLRDRPKLELLSRVARVIHDLQKSPAVNRTGDIAQDAVPYVAAGLGVLSALFPEQAAAVLPVADQLPQIAAAAGGAWMGVKADVLGRVGSSLANKTDEAELTGIRGKLRQVSERIPSPIMSVAKRLGNAALGAAAMAGAAGAAGTGIEQAAKVVPDIQPQHVAAGTALVGTLDDLAAVGPAVAQAGERIKDKVVGTAPRNTPKPPKPQPPLK